MRKLLVSLSLGALACAIVATAAPAAPVGSSTWASDANQVCVVWLAKAKKEFGNPVTASQLYSFAVKAKKLESQELAVLKKIPNRTSSGTHALAALQVDVNEVGTAITAYQAGNAQRFVTILKRYLNDERPKAAFAAAGASQCG
jgi:hypothetical protein